MKRNIWRVVALGAISLGAVHVARGQALGDESFGLVRACSLPVDAPDARHIASHLDVGTYRLLRSACSPGTRTSAFDVTFEGFPPDAEAAFRAALDTWACQVSSNIPIRVTARWTPLNPTTLGNAGPFLFRNFQGAPHTDTWYPAALADHFAGRDLNPGQPDIQAEFNSSFGAWHLDHATPPPTDAYDLFTVVLHEIGHGLGFIGAMRVEQGRGRVGEPEGPAGAYTYDRHTQDNRAISLLDEAVYPNNSIELGNALRSAVFFDGAATNRVHSEPVPLFAPSVWSTGGSYSHLDEGSFAPATPDGLMTPFVTRGESYDLPGPVTCGILFDIGWTLAGDCATQVGDVPRGTSRVEVALDGPNPFRGATRVVVSMPASGPLRVVLADALGRAVSVLRDGEGSETEVFDINAHDLASGVYLLIAFGGGGVSSVPLVVMR